MHFLSASVEETLCGQTYNFNPPEAKMAWIVATFSPIARIIDTTLKSIRSEKIKLSLQNLHGSSIAFPRKVQKLHIYYGIKLICLSQKVLNHLLHIHNVCTGNNLR